MSTPITRVILLLISQSKYPFLKFWGPIYWGTFVETFVCSAFVELAGRVLWNKNPHSASTKLNPEVISIRDKMQESGYCLTIQQNSPAKAVRNKNLNKSWKELQVIGSRSIIPLVILFLTNSLKQMSPQFFQFLQDKSGISFKQNYQKYLHIRSKSINHAIF